MARDKLPRLDYSCDVQIDPNTETTLERREPAHAAAQSISWPDGIMPTPEFVSALDFIRTAEGHLFVTGRAGTGKSTLLRALRDNGAADMAVLAPTGLAAINVGGQTIHSFFGFPPRLIQSEDIRRSRNGRLMRKLQLLVIDEVSMVRSDLMWAIDYSLRLNRGRPREPFGGVRLVMFGDLHQLPPISLKITADRFSFRCLH